MLRLALLGVDDQALALAAAAVSSGRWLISSGCELGAEAANFHRLHPAAQVADAWEALLSGEAADGVIVAQGASAERDEQLRKLVQVGVPAIVTYPIRGSLLISYELAAMQEEHRAVLMPHLPARRHPAVAVVQRWMSGVEEGLGAVQQIVFDRLLPSRTERTVLDAFAEDADLLRCLCGELNKVSAFASGQENRYASLGMQLSGPSGVLVRWTVGPVDAVAEGRLTLIGAAGKTVLCMPAQEGSWSVSHPGAPSFAPWNPAAATLEVFEEAMQGAVATPRWSDALRAAELAEAAVRSLAKGRTVELHAADHSEEATFKGVMSAWGCGMLLLALAVLAAAAFLTRTGLAWAAYLPHVLLAGLLAFLLLQFLQFVFRKQES